MHAIATVLIPSGQTVSVGSTVQLTFSAQDAEGKVLAVSPGSAYWSDMSSLHLSLTSDGVATGNAVGSDQVEVMVDGVASSQTGVSVIEPAAGNFIFLSQMVSDIVYNPADGKLYASVPGSATANANSIVAIDPSSGAITGSVFVGSEPSKLALSGDGTVLYVALDGSNSICSVTLPALVVGKTFSLNAGTGTSYVATSMAVVPGSTQSVVVSEISAANSFQGSLDVYDNGVARPNHVSIFGSPPEPITFGADPTTLYSINTGFSSGTVYKIDASGVQPSTTNATLLVGQRIGFVGGKLYLSTGDVVDAQSLGLLGTLSIGSTNGLSWYATNPAGTQAYLLSSYSPIAYRVDSTSTFAQLGTATLPISLGYSVSSVAAFGTSGLAIAVGGGPNQLPGMVVIVKDALQGTSIAP